MQIHNATSPTCSDEGALIDLMLLIFHVHLLYVLPVLFVLVFLMGADDGGSEPYSRAELHGGVVQKPLLGLMFSIGGLGHIGMAALEPAD